MPDPVKRVVDAHVHLWDPARTDWYPYLAPESTQLAELGDMTWMRRRFGHPDYVAVVRRWNVEKYVHVTAASSHALTETAGLESQADTVGQPAAIIGGLDGRASATEIVQQLDQQCAAKRFRGVRVNRLDYESEAARVLARELQDRDLVFDLNIRPSDMVAVARTLERFDRLTVVVEHTGRPHSGEDQHMRTWQEGMAAMAALGERVHCKLSGLGMTFHCVDAAVYAPWIEQSLALFGVERCFFASNFPVDGNYGTFDELYGVYDTLSAGLDAAAREQLFAGNAERVYTC